MLWTASIIAQPFVPLPYLFMHGDENCGKSVLGEMLRELFTCGVVSGDRALTSDFNGELENAIIAIVVEKDIHTRGVIERLKHYVTALSIPIRRMRTDQYECPNSLHWIQCANDRNHCPVFAGDTRIVSLFVDKLHDEIPKDELRQRCIAEAPAFLNTLLTVGKSLPEPAGRLFLPVLETDSKRRLMESNSAPIASAVVEMMQDKQAWAGSAANLLVELDDEALPRDARIIRKQLASSAPYLRRHSIKVEMPDGIKRIGKSAGKIITISKI